MEWRAIPGYPGYEASSEGSIRSVNRIDAAGRRLKGKVLKTHANNHGYLHVSPCLNGAQKPVPVHILVCLAFHGVPSEGVEVNHRSNLRTDTRPDNLYWATHRHNCKVRGRPNYNVKLARGSDGRYIGVETCAR